MKIVSHKRISRIRFCGRTWTIMNSFGYCGFGAVLKVTAVVLICCTIIAFQVSSSIYVSKSDADLHPHPKPTPDPCDSCSDSDAAEIQAIRDIANEEFELISAAEDNSANIKIVLNLKRDKPSEEGKTTTTSQLSENLDNVFFSVKSTKRFHKSRLEPVLKTWYNLAKDQMWIFTDDDDPELVEKTNGHIINTHCPSTHYRQALCCKMASEFDTFIQTTKSWFCHFDDDNYVNVPALLELLVKYNAREYWYLGKPSLKSPIRIRDPDNHTEEVSFWFATGGAGFCLSRALALRMSPLASGGKFTKMCDRIQLPDDVTIGYIAGHLLGQNLTVIPQFHSHFETMKFIDMKNLASEITFSYLSYPEYENVLDVEGFSSVEDPTRFLSIHCKLFPNFYFCPSATTRRDYSDADARRRRRRRR